MSTPHKPNWRTRLACFFGLHKWKNVSKGRDGISFLDECDHCGRGRYLHFLGHASYTGTLNREEMEAWRRDALTAK